jgi:hypothetical protein
LGCIHPWDASRHYEYGALPMGAANSPSIAGRYGTAFLRLLRSVCPLCQGIPTQNTLWTSFSGIKKYNPALGHVRVLIGTDGLPAILLWSHCDNFFLHGPTKDKTTAALIAFLDKAVDVGMLCHPGKLAPPAQLVKYAGLIFYTAMEPKLLVPEDKRAKSLAMIEYAQRNHKRISRLALAVVVGVLKSLVEATPTRIGHTFLRHLQHTLHPLGWDGVELPYFSYTPLTSDDLREFSMWTWVLKHDYGRRARAQNPGTLIPSFGDGSDTDTGGTVKYKKGDPFEMWMGV